MRYKSILTAIIVTLLGLIPLIIRTILGKPFIYNLSTYSFLNQQKWGLSPEQVMLLNILLIFIQVFLISLLIYRDLKARKNKYILFTIMAFISITSLIYAFQPTYLSWISFIPILIYYFLKTNKSLIIPIILLPISILLGIESFLASLIIFIIVNLKKKSYYTLIGGLITILLLLPTMILLNLFKPFIYLNLSIGISETAAILGIPAFLLIISITPLLLNKYKDSELFFLIPTLLLLNIVYADTILITGLLLVILSIDAVIIIDSYKWSMESLKESTLTLFVLINLFIYLSFINISIHSEPTNCEIKVLEKMGKIANTINKHEGMLSLEKYGDMIYYYSGIKMINGNINELLLLTNYSNARKIYKSRGVSYVFITPQMDKEYWEINDNGLKYLYKYTDIFTIVSRCKDTYGETLGLII